MTSEIKDLMQGDTPFELSEEIVESHKNKTILITGAAGTIGSELAKYLVSIPDMKLLLLDHSELGLFNLEQQFESMGITKIVSYVLGDICDQVAMDDLFQKHQPEIVYHAAAYKHVKFMELQPYQAVKVNIGGTVVLSDLSEKYAIKKFVLISTDKAVNPAGILGYSKKIAELYLQTIEALKSKFITVRFGNVLGSSGSLIPKIENQIKNGGPVTLTHEQVERYFMSKSEACSLVLEAATMGVNRDLLVLNLRDSIRVKDIVEYMIAQHKDSAEVKIEVVGLQKGEKLKEELYDIREFKEETVHPRIFKIKSSQNLKKDVRNQIKNLCQLNLEGKLQDYKSEFIKIIHD